MIHESSEFGGTLLQDRRFKSSGGGMVYFDAHIKGRTGTRSPILFKFLIISSSTLSRLKDHTAVPFPTRGLCRG
jgi:hypothetical protein